MKLPPWLKDRKVQIGIAAAAGLGLIVAVRRSQGGGGGLGGGGGSSPQSISPAVMDSSGTDVYNAIQSLGQGWQNDLREFTGQLEGVQTQLTTNTTAIGKLGTTKAPAATVKQPTYNAVVIDGTGYKKSLQTVANYYNAPKDALLGLAKNKHLVGLSAQQLKGQTFYVPTQWKPDPPKKPVKKK